MKNTSSMCLIIEKTNNSLDCRMTFVVLFMELDLSLSIPISRKIFQMRQYSYTFILLSIKPKPNHFIHKLIRFKEAEDSINAITKKEAQSFTLVTIHIPEN